MRWFFKSINVTIDDKELAMAVLYRLLPNFELLIVALDTIDEDDESFSFDFVQSRLLPEKRRMELQASLKVLDSALNNTRSILVSPEMILAHSTAATYAEEMVIRRLTVEAKMLKASDLHPGQVFRMNFKEELRNICHQ